LLDGDVALLEPAARGFEPNVRDQFGGRAAIPIDEFARESARRHLHAPGKKLDAEILFEVLEDPGAVGTWLYNGGNLATPDQKGAKWKWLEKCRWSDNDAFMARSFVMNGPDTVVKSLAISTYNDGDKSYWHYEAFDSGGDGGHPYIARMTVKDDTWTYEGKASGKTYRVIYHYESPVQVTLRIELSTDSVHWTTVAQGVGHKR
jgi:hypothetical protein